MSLSVYLTEMQPTRVFSGNITGNLQPMAKAAGLADAIWHPEKLGVSTAVGLITPLGVGLATLEADPEKFKALNPANGWGSYEGLVAFVREYLEACRRNPEAEIGFWR